MQKLIYQKDISEHCRRRVFPSIFLGRQVVNANSQILQFSRLELPYSCFITIRTESGSNMIMMIQLASDDLKKSCSAYSQQLLVYEIGETFGGYWGPLPDSVMKQKSVDHRFYTLKTTHTTTTLTTPSPIEAEHDEYEDESSSSTTEGSEQAKDPRDFIEVEIPIVNVSVHLVPGPRQPTKAFDQEIAFDLQNDVTPIVDYYTSIGTCDSVQHSTIDSLQHKYVGEGARVITGLMSVGGAYDTKIMPLVQFSLREEHVGRRVGDDEAPKYELDIEEEFTPDMRLTLPQLSSTKRRKPYHKRRYQVTKRLNFKKHKNLINSERYLDRQIVPRVTTYEFPTKRIIQKKPTHDNESWHIIEDLIKKLNETEGYAKQTNTVLQDANVLENIANLRHNLSVYLLPNWSQYKEDGGKKLKKILNTRESTILSYTQKIQYNDTKRFSVTPYIKDTITDLSLYKLSIENNGNNEETGITISDKIHEENVHTTKAFVFQPNSEDPEEEATDVMKATESSTDSINIEFEFPEQSGNGITSATSNSKSVTAGSLVGHESWENVVQAAPEMAIKLNQTVAYVTNHNTSYDIATELNETRHDDKLLIRKKKEIHSIYIENARPHNLTTKAERKTTTMSEFEVADMQEFAQLVELQDNELHGRVALRYLRQYVGPMLYNLCDLAESTQRHVHLFNSSRIVLSISNFTLDRMIIILTSARTLLSGETRCPSSHLECQVSGARVCLDSMVACDGVPNCGSFDIYDEDRLLCGASKGLQHNVYLAAFTFLAVLLTALYAVHYWLKRCVSGVADAFFVYMNGVENVLYLDSVMRSPNDTEDVSKMVYHSTFFGDDNIYEDFVISEETNAFKSFLRKCCFCFEKKQAEKHFVERDEKASFNHLLQQRRLYSFTYSDIHNMFQSSRDTSVQTGASLEMKYLVEKSREPLTKVKNIVQLNNDIPSSPPILIQDSILTLDEPLPEEHTDELNLMKFFRAARKSVSNISIFEDPKAKDKNKSEIELKSYHYDDLSETEPGPSAMISIPKKKTVVASAEKHLRFDEVTTTIPFVEYQEEHEHEEIIVEDRNLQLGDNRSRRHSMHLDTIEEADEQNTPIKETRHFWGTSKLKKTKKKSHILR